MPRQSKQGFMVINWNTGGLWYPDQVRGAEELAACIEAIISETGTDINYHAEEEEQGDKVYTHLDIISMLHQDPDDPGRFYTPDGKIDIQIISIDWRTFGLLEALIESLPGDWLNSRAGTYKLID